MEPSYLSAPLAEIGTIARPQFFLQRVLVLYRSQFLRWFGITAPTSVLAAIVLLVADRRIKEIFGSVSRSGIQRVAELSVLRFGSFFISWLLGCFALAAIATVVGRLDDDGDDADMVWRHDSHQKAREHLGEIVIVAFVTFCAFMAGLAVAEFVEFAALRLVGGRHFSHFYLAAMISCVVVASIVGWLGMSIPLILKGNTTVWSALKESVRLSNGREGDLFLLVVESLAGSYLAWYASYYVMAFLFPDHLQHTVWYGWLAYGVSVLTAAAVEPPIFIGFSLLANPELNSSSLPVTQQAT
jgi:hypothetical protein